MTPWSLVYEGFDPEKEGLREALCTLGNGYFATRGAAPESSADGVHYPGTYLAGGYNRLVTRVAGRVIENEDLVNLPNWLVLTFRQEGGEWFRLSDVEILDYRQELDIRKGILYRTVRFRDREGRTTRVENRRIVNMRDPHLAALDSIIEAEDWSGPIQIRTALDGRVTNSGVARYRNLNSRHLEPLSTTAVGDEIIALKVQTVQSELRIAEAARTRVFRDGERVVTERRVIEEPGYIAQEFAVDLAPRVPLRVEKVVTLYTSRDHAIDECGLMSREMAQKAGGLERQLERHTLAWQHLWERFEIELELADAANGNRMLMVLHLHEFHLLQSTSLHTMDLDVGVPSRGWHGEAYRGHVFWDEVFIFPLFNLRLPEITRSLLRYRIRRLNESRKSAREAGYRGAMYPWQSGSSGREESQRLHLNPKSGRWIPDHSSLQRHVNAAIAYNVWRYYQSTRDVEFLAYGGGEMLLEIARFWASIATYSEDSARYEILGVMGPDEYHDAYPNAEQPGLNNNTYTNFMATWVLCAALHALQVLPVDRERQLKERLGIQEDELQLWEDMTHRMKIPFHGDGIISQFEGYQDLEEFDWEGYRKKYGDIRRLDRLLEAEDDTVNRYQASKQADVLMLFYLFPFKEVARILEQLGYQIDRKSARKNVDYYLARTSHGSSLSAVVHSLILAEWDGEHAWQLFNEALMADVGDVQGGTTAEGIHLGAMAGTVDYLQRVAAGVATRGDVLWLEPKLPKELRRLGLRIRYRGHSLTVQVTPAKLKVKSLHSAGRPIKLGVKEKLHDLTEGETKEFPL